MIDMKIFGYQNDNDELLKLQEVSLQCTIEELESIIDFLIETKKEHESVRGRTDICHSHLRDWDKLWKKDDPDFIVVTNYKNEQ